MPGINITGTFQPSNPDGWDLITAQDINIAGATDYTGVTVENTDLLICDTSGAGAVGKITVNQIGKTLLPNTNLITAIQWDETKLQYKYRTITNGVFGDESVWTDVPTV